MIQSIVILNPGETPQSHKNPDRMIGPWGATVDESLAAFESEEALDVLQHWHDLGSEILWVICASASQF